MNFFKIKTTWSNVELLVFKISIASAAAVAGSYFHNFISANYLPILVVFSFTYILSGYLWLSKMRAKNRK